MDAQNQDQVIQEQIMSWLLSKRPDLSPSAIATALHQALNHNGKNIQQRMLGVMADVEYVKKSDKMVNGQYKAVLHDDVSGKLHPYLVKHGIYALPTTLEFVQEGNRTAEKVRVTFQNVDCPTDCVHVDMWGYGVDGSDKGPGKACSYAYKYALLKAFMLETGDDPDKDAKTVYEAPKCVEFDIALPSMTKKQRSELDEFLNLCMEGKKVGIEELKASAMKDMDSFLRGFHAWQNKRAKND